METLTLDAVDDPDLLFTFDDEMNAGSEHTGDTRPAEIELSCRVHRGHTWRMVTVSYRQVSTLPTKLAYLTVWEHSDGDYVDLAGRQLQRWRRTWGPGEASYALAQLESDIPMPPVPPDPDGEEE